MAIASVELNGKIVEANGACQNLMGYSHDELSQMSLRDLVYEEDRPIFEELLARLHKGEAHDFRSEMRHRRKDGQVIWVLGSVSLIHDRQTSSGSIIYIAQDVTALKLEAENFKQKNEILEKICEDAPVMISLVGADGSIRHVNPEWQRTLGWSTEELVRAGEDALALCYPDADFRSKILESMTASQDRWTEAKTRTKDGRVKDTAWIWSSALGDGTAVTFGKDLAEQIRREQSLRRTQACLAELERISHIGSWRVIASLHDHIFCSAEYRRIFEFDEGENPISLDTLRQRIHPEDRPGFDRVREDIFPDKQGFEIDFRIVLPDGSLKYCRGVCRPVLNEQGDVDQFIGLVMDLTEKKLAEQERQGTVDQLRALTARLQTIREEERTRLAREIHDELGQALTAIKIDLSSILHKLPDEQRWHEITASVVKLVDETIKSVRRIATELRPRVLDDLGLAAAIEWAAEEFESRTGIGCRLKLSEGDVPPDRERDTALFRIVQESLTNIARHANATHVDIRLAKDSADVRLEIRDNGSGATPEQFAALTSLGIRGMRERALLLGGELLVHSSGQEGTEVAVRIPLYPGPTVRRLV